MIDFQDPYQIWFVASIIWTVIFGILFGNLRKLLLSCIAEFRDTIDAIDDAVDPTGEAGCEISKEEVARIVSEARSFIESTAALMDTFMGIIRMKR